MSWLTDVANQLKGVGTGLQSEVNTTIPALQKTGGTLTDWYKQSAPEEYRNVFWDPSRDTGPNAAYRVATFADQIAAGKNPFAGEGEIEYNQNMAKRAAIVASIFGGAALAGGAGAGSTAGSTAPVVAPAAETTVAAGGGATGGGTVAPTTTYGVGAGNTGGLGLTEAGMSGGGMAGTMGGAGGGGSTAGMFGGGAGAGAGSWGPYAQAGGTILSTLFQGLMQMEQAKEQRDMEIRMAKAKANIERAQAENAALDRLIQIWGRRS